MKSHRSWKDAPAESNKVARWGVPASAKSSGAWPQRALSRGARGGHPSHSNDLGHVQEFRHCRGWQHVGLVDEECDAGAATAVDQAQVGTASFVGSDAEFVFDVGDGGASVAVDCRRRDVDVGVGGGVAHQASKLAEQNCLSGSARADQDGPPGGCGARARGRVGRTARVEIDKSLQCALQVRHVRLPARQMRRRSAWRSAERIGLPSRVVRHHAALKRLRTSAQFPGWRSATRSTNAWLGA